MRYHFFVIPVANSHDAEDDLNRFLGSTRVLTVHREFVVAGENSFWAMAVEYLPGQSDTVVDAGRGGKAKIDYREVLSEEEFSLYAQLRDWRKEKAAKGAVPVYTLFTNEQLAEIVRKKIESLDGLRAIAGVGDAKVDKYGREVIAIVQGVNSHETGGPPLSADR